MTTRRAFIATAMAGIASALGACDRDFSTDPLLDAATLKSRVHPPDLTPVVGFSALGLAEPFTDRDGLLYVPSTYDAAVAAPLIVLLHGAGQNASIWNNPELAALADLIGAVVLAPDSRGFASWDMLESGQYGRDVEFIDRALARTFRLCNIHPHRIAMGGFSDGASEALGLGVANGDFFNAIIAFSPGVLYAPFRRAAPRVFISHGTADSILPFANTRDVIVPALREMGLTVEFVEFDGNHAVPSDIGDRAFDWFQSAWVG